MIIIAKRSRFDHGNVKCPVIISDFIMPTIINTIFLSFSLSVSVPVPFLFIFNTGHLYTTAGNRFPGDLAPDLPFTDVKAGLAAFDNIPLGCSLQILAFIGFLENGFGLIQEDLEADCLNYMENNGYSPEKIASKKAIELNNGRAAQMGILALMVHEKLDNNPYIINDLLGAPVPFNQ